MDDSLQRARQSGARLGMEAAAIVAKIAKQLTVAEFSFDDLTEDEIEETEEFYYNIHALAESFIEGFENSFPVPLIDIVEGSWKPGA